jgi:hypothetical protein
MGLQTKALGFVAISGINSYSNKKAESVVKTKVNNDSLHIDKVLLTITNNFIRNLK